MSSYYYCPKHKYYPPENSGLCFCPKCELAKEKKSPNRREIMRKRKQAFFGQRTLD